MAETLWLDRKHHRPAISHCAHLVGEQVRRNVTADYSLCLSAFQQTGKFEAELCIAFLDHRGERGIGSGTNQKLKRDQPRVAFPGSSPGNHAVENRPDIDGSLITQPPVEFIEQRFRHGRDHRLFVCKGISDRARRAAGSGRNLAKRSTRVPLARNHVTSGLDQFAALGLAIADWSSALRAFDRFRLQSWRAYGQATRSLMPKVFHANLLFNITAVALIR